MTVVAFPTKPRVVITSGFVRETRVTSRDGVRITRHHPPIKTFFLTFVDGDESFSLWDGEHLETALTLAQGWTAQGAEVLDQTSETRGRA